jgi:hypothetical protein
MSTDEAVSRNGSAEVDPLAGIVAQLEHELAPISARKAQLEAEIGELLKQEGRIKAGITALRGSAPKRSAPAPRGSVGTGGTGNVWTPSQKTQDAVYAVLATADEPLTVKQIAEQVDVSSSTVKQTIDVLRSEQKIRICGTAPSQGAPKLYGPMR